MRDVLRQVIPSMFHRRLLLLATVTLILTGTLAAKTAHLTTGDQRQQRQQIIRKSLERPDLTPTARGRIFDRKGRLLAEDRPGWDIQVSFRVLSGNWAYVASRRAAERSVGRSAWRDLTAAQQDALAEPYVKPYLLKIEALQVTLAELGNVPRPELEARRRSLVQSVHRMAAYATNRKRENRLRVLTEDQELDWADVYVEVSEQYQSHTMLHDVTPETVTWIRQFIALAQQEEERYQTARRLAREAGQEPPADERQYDVWLEVTPKRVRKRTYPWESMGFVFDASTLPGPMKRNHPLQVDVEGIGRHIIGSLRPIHSGDDLWSQRPYNFRATEDGPLETDLGGYRPGDPIGRAGVEASMEYVLRGKRGQRVTHLDTGEQQVTRPEVGGDVQLTVDMALQMRVQAFMSHDPDIGLMISQEWHHAGDAEAAPRPGDRLNGAAVVLEIDTGDVLAAVSVPGTSLDLIENRSAAYFGDFDNRPYDFRPVVGRYEPGSTNKPLVLAAAITDGIIGPDQTLDCSTGHLWPGKPNLYRDWIYRAQYGLATFGVIDGVQAITVSSNVFFGKLAQMFGQNQGYQRLAWWFHEFGFGRPLHSGLPHEIDGTVVGLDGSLSEADAAYMAIGEGALSVTPLQVAHAHATLARGGLEVAPSFIRSPRPDTADDAADNAPAHAAGGTRLTGRHLHLSPAAVDRALRGMDRSANYRGTDGRNRGTTYWIGFADGSHERVFNTPHVQVLAKSGTAQPMPLRRTFAGGETKRDGTTARPGDYDPDGVILREGYHAWVIALVQPEGEPRPTHAIACVVEYGGSGGRTAGPIVNQIIRALAAEGYLGDAAQEAVAPPAPSLGDRGDRPRRGDEAAAGGSGVATPSAGLPIDPSGDRPRPLTGLRAA